MSLDIEFNKSISIREIRKKTTLKVVEMGDSKFLEDEYGNVVFAKGDPIYGITLYGGPRNPVKILDELITVFGIKFMDDEAIDMYSYEPDKYENIDLFTPTMLNYGYLLNFDGKIVIPEREESDYLPYSKEKLQEKEEEENKEIKTKLIEMGYCVESIFSYFAPEDVDKSVADLPDKAILVELCDGKFKTFKVFGERIEELPEFKKGDELPF